MKKSLQEFWEYYEAFDWGEILYTYWLDRIGSVVERMSIDICNN